MPIKHLSCMETGGAGKSNLVPGTRGRQNPVVEGQYHHNIERVIVLKSKLRSRRARTNLVLGITLMVLVAALILLWEFHGYAFLTRR